MSDRREQVMARLLELAGEMAGVRSATRNQDEISDLQYPCISIMDADESGAESDPTDTGRPAHAPRFVTMVPEVWIKLGSVPADVGTQLNALRTAWLKAVLNDNSLKEILGNNGSMYYLGCQTQLARGRRLLGEMGVSIAFTYILNPGRL